MVPYVDAVVTVTVKGVLLFVVLVCMPRECNGARVTAMLVWVMEEVWLWWVIHVIQVLCLAQLTRYG